MNAANPGASRAMLWRDRNFRWLISGALISMLGDQFTLIALPWLVLRLTGDTLMLGAVLAVIGIPRALFILIGGAMVDKYSPKRVLMLTKYVNLVLLGTLAALVLAGALQMWMVFVLAAGIGLATAFSYPSGSSMMPHTVPRALLQPANSVMMGVRQLTSFAGPLVAGLLIAVFGDRGGDTAGLGAAFAFDALSFAVSAWTLARVALLPAPEAAHPAAHPAALRQSVLGAVSAGLRLCWDDREMRTCFLYWAAVMLFVSGPIQVAMPVVAAQLGDSAATFGTLVGMHGAGTLAGMLISGSRPGLRLRSFGLTILCLDTVVALLFMPMGSLHHTWQVAALMLLTGAFSGALQVMVLTWLQQRVQPAMMGRIMSVFMFIMIGIGPLSAAVTGWIMRSLSPAWLFAGSGGALLAIVAIAWLTSPMKNVGEYRAAVE